MAIAPGGPGSIPGTSSGGLSLSGMDFYPSWGPNRREAAWLAFDIGLLFTPASLLSGINKGRLALKLLRAERAADKTVDTYRLGAAARDILIQRRVRTGLMIGLGAPGAFVTTSGLWVVPMMASEVGDVAIGIYRDRDGRIRTFLPNLSNPQYESRGGQGTVLPAARRPRSFFDGKGIATLASTNVSRTPQSQWSIATLSGRASNMAAQHPLAEGPRTRARSAPSRRGKTISPWCPVHRRKHWCNVTRAKF